MGLAPYNPFMGQTIKDQAGNANDRAFLAHYHVDGADAPAPDDDYLFANKATTTAAQEVIAFLNALASPRVIVATCSAAGIVDQVIIDGTDSNGDTLQDIITLNGAQAIAGDRAFGVVTKVTLPACRKQSGKITVTNGAAANGNITATVTCTAPLLAGGTATTGNIAVLQNDTPEIVAGKIAAVIDADATIGVAFDCVAVGADVILTAKLPAVQDAAYGISLTANATGVVAGAYAGVVGGIVSSNIKVGITGALAIPYKLGVPSILAIYNAGVATTVASNSVSPTVLAANYITPTAALNATDIDVYLAV